MNDTYNWFYNPNFVNRQNYWQHQNEIMQYQLNQQKETLNVYKAMRDFLDAIQKLNPQHRDEFYILFLGEIAQRCNWDKNRPL